MKRTKFYVCPDCGNLVTASAEAALSCCGKPLAALEPQKADEAHRLTVEPVENELFITSGHVMESCLSSFLAAEYVVNTFPGVPG